MCPIDQHSNTQPKPATEQEGLAKNTIKVNSIDTLPPLASEAVTIKPGMTLNNRFDILEVIGAGGMGTVYKALDKRDIEAGNSCFIAIKVLNSACNKSAQFLQALYEETKKTQSLSHPNIVTVYDFDRDSDLVYMTMELIEGAPLDKIIKRNKLGVDLSDAINIISQMGSALSYAHSKHIIHLDLKPNNIFYDRNKHIKILDFGISQKLNSSLANNDEPGIAMALTPAYASLELLYDEVSGPSDDIYAFACVCYEVLTGKHPYNRERADIAFKKKLVPEKIKFLNRQQWKALKQALALQKHHRTESVDKFLSEFNAKKSSLKLVILGVFLILLLAFSFNQFQTDSRLSVGVDNAGKGESHPRIVQSKEKVLGSLQTGEPIYERTKTMSPAQPELVKEQGNIKLWTDKEAYVIGGTLTVNFEVDTNLYVQVFVVNSLGKVDALFPNPYQPDNLLQAGIMYQIPPKNAKFTLDISVPKGKDRIIAFASAKPFPDNMVFTGELGIIKKNVLIESYIQAQTSYLIY